MPRYRPFRVNCFHPGCQVRLRVRGVHIWFSGLVCILIAHFSLGVGIGYSQDEASSLEQNVQSAQVSSDDDPSNAELPKNSMWRIGAFGAASDSNGYYFLRMSPNGKYLAARNRDNVLRVFNVEDQKKLCQITGHESRILRIEFSPDSKYLITSAPGIDEAVKVWESETGKMALQLEPDSISACFSKDGSEITLLGDTEVFRYRWPDGQLLAKKRWSTSNETGMAVSRDGTYVASYQALTGQHYRCHVSNTRTGSQVMLDGSTALPLSMVISDDNQWLAVRYRGDVKVRIWNLENPRTQKHDLRGHARNVDAIAFSEDNRFLISTSRDKTSILWDLLTRQKIGFLRGHTATVTSAAFSPVNHMVVTGASGEEDSSILAWDLNKYLFPYPPRRLRTRDFDAAWSRLGSSSPDNALRAVSDIQFSWDDLEAVFLKKIGALNSVVENQDVSAWIEQLASSSFIEREKATKLLIQSRRSAESLLRQTFKETSSSEIRYRITKILNTSVERQVIGISESRRLHRSVFLLELIGDDTAKEALRSMSLYHPNIDVARDAADSLARLELKD